LNRVLLSGFFFHISSPASFICFNFQLSVLQRFANCKITMCLAFLLLSENGPLSLIFVHPHGLPGALCSLPPFASSFLVFRETFSLKNSVPRSTHLPHVFDEKKKVSPLRPLPPCGASHAFMYLQWIPVLVLIVPHTSPPHGPVRNSQTKSFSSEFLLPSLFPLPSPPRSRRDCRWFAHFREYSSCSYFSYPLQRFFPAF